MTDEASTELGMQVSNDMLAIIVTHDCDLLQPPEVEPSIEFLIGNLIEKDQFDGNYTNAKNARKLHLPIEGASKPFVELQATPKQINNKTNLAKFSPAPIRLNAHNKVILGRWLAKRYRRSAFPDEFETRLSKHKLDRRIYDAVKNCDDSIWELYFDLKNPDVALEENFRLGIVILYNTASNAEVAKTKGDMLREKIEFAFQKALFDSEQETWKDIELEYVDVVSDNALSYRQSQFLKAWRLEHISLGNVPQQPIAVE